MERLIDNCEDGIIDLGAASVETQGMGFGATDTNGQPKNPGGGGISDD